MKSIVTHSRGHRVVQPIARLMVTLVAVSALLATGLTFVATSSASAATSTLVTGITLNLSNSAKYVATSTPYTGSGTGSAWTVTVPQDSAASTSSANYTLSSIDVVMPQADTTKSPITVVSLTSLGSAVPYGALTYSGSGTTWTLKPDSTQYLRTAGTQVLQAPVVDTGAATTIVQLTLNVAPLVSSVTLHTNYGAAYLATSIPYTGSGNGSAWTVTVRQDSVTTAGAAHYILSSIDVVMPQADVTKSPIAVVSVTSPGHGVSYGTLTHVSGATWILTPRSTQYLQTAGTWVLQASVPDVGGAANTVQVTLVVDPRPSLFTDPVSNVTSTEATVNGSVTNYGTDTVTSLRLCYSTSIFATNQCTSSVGTIMALPSSNATVPYRTTLFRLRAGTTYYVAFEAIDSTTGTLLRGGIQSFITASALMLTSTRGTVGTPLTLTSSGGMGTGVVSYAVTSAGTAGCTITRGKLMAIRAGTCTVTVTKAGDARYQFTHSPVTTVTFANAARRTQATLKLASTNGTFGTALLLTSSGGSGVGAVTYGVTSTGTAGCWITSGRLNATRVGTCTVTVTKAGDATYLAASSAATAVTFKAAPVTFRASRTLGFVRVGQTSIIAIIGKGFYGKPRITSSDPGTRAVVIHDRGYKLVVRVHVRPGSAQGWHAFTITLANGHASQVKYLAKAGPVRLRASRVNGFALVGRTVLLAIEGNGFYGKPRITSNDPGTRAVVIHDHGDQLVARVKVLPGSPRGWHVLTIILANGDFCRVRYLVK